MLWNCSGFIVAAIYARPIKQHTLSRSQHKAVLPHEKNKLGLLLSSQRFGANRFRIITFLKHDRSPLRYSNVTCENCIHRLKKSFLLFKNVSRATIKFSERPFWNRIFRSIRTVTESNGEKKETKRMKLKKRQLNYTLATSPRGSGVDNIFFFRVSHCQRQCLGVSHKKLLAVQARVVNCWKFEYIFVRQRFLLRISFFVVKWNGFMFEFVRFYLLFLTLTNLFRPLY